jgi:adenine-specific DNA methylase
LAVEETSDSAHRRIRKPAAADNRRIVEAEEFLSKAGSDLQLPTSEFDHDRRDSRPISFGVTKPRQLFSPRQLAAFGLAFRWLQRAELTPQTRRGLSLAVSNALTSNNILCGYATDYGRLAPLFSVRSYSLPILSVELNPFHPTAGRGTLVGALRKAAKVRTDSVIRYIWSVEAEQPVRKTLPHRGAESADANVLCASASAPIGAPEPDIDICIFDPPYFDYIAYSELSEFYRSWLGQSHLGGVPLLPDDKDPVGSFANGLADCLSAALRRLRSGRLMVFTFHSTSEQAWQAIGESLDRAGLLITALWPLRNDSHMGHHSNEGNCEWDIAVVCRRAVECERAHCTLDISDWTRNCAPLPVSDTDRRNMTLAIEMARSRFGEASRSSNDCRRTATYDL